MCLLFPTTRQSAGWISKFCSRMISGPSTKKNLTFTCLVFSVQWRLFHLISHIIMIFIAQYYIMLFVFFLYFHSFFLFIIQNTKLCRLFFHMRKEKVILSSFFSWNVYGKEAERLKNPMLNIIIRAKENTQQFKLKMFFRNMSWQNEPDWWIATKKSTFWCVVTC